VFGFGLKLLPLRPLQTITACLTSIGGIPCENVVRSLVAYEADDGSQMLAVGESAWAESYIELVDVRTSTVLRKLSGHNMAILDLSVLNIDDKKYIVSCVFSISLYFWPPEFQHGFLTVIGSADQEVRIFDLSDPGGQSRAMYKHVHRVLAVSTPVSVPLVAGGSYDSSIFILPKLFSGGTSDSKIDLVGHRSHVTRVRFMPGFSGANRLISCSYDQTVSVWDVEIATQVISMKASATDSNDKYHDLNIHKHGHLVATGSQDALVRLWDSRVGWKCVHEIKGHSDFVLSVAFGSNEFTLFSGSKDRTVRMWDIRKFAIPIVTKKATEGDQ